MKRKKLQLGPTALALLKLLTHGHQALCAAFLLIATGNSFVGIPSIARADTFEWTNAAAGKFETPGNWTLVGGGSAAPPGVGDTSYFNEASPAYTVIFGQNAFSDALNIVAGDVAFYSGITDRTYDITSGEADVFIANASLTLGVNGSPLDLNIGDNFVIGNDGRLNVLFGSEVSSGGLAAIGISPTVTAAVASIDGAGSSWTSSSVLYVGATGAGEMYVTDGGTVSSFLGRISQNSASTGTATIEDAGSSWTTSSFLWVGEEGDGTLNILNGGAVSSFSGNIGVGSSSIGTTTVDGVGSTWTSGGLTIGLSGNGKLNIQNGGVVSSTFGQIGSNSGSISMVNVDGTGSTWSNSTDLWVGGSSLSAGGTGTLSVQNNGLVEVGDELKIWDTGTITLDDGIITTSDFTKVPGGTLNLNGGLFKISGGTANFNSSFSYGGTNPGNEPFVRIENGADAVITYTWRMADNPGESASTIVVGTGNGQRSTLRGTGGGGGADLIVGGGGSGTLLVNAGGLVDLRDDFIVARDAGSDGHAIVTGVLDGFRSTVDVTGSGSGSTIQIGGGDGGGAGVGELTIMSGGLVQTSSDVLLARYLGSEAYVSVSGSSGGFAAELDVADDIFVGGAGTTAGGTAVLTIENGGIVRADAMVLFQGGDVQFSGGDIYVNSLDIGTGNFNFIGGTLHADDILGDLVNNGGTIAPGDSPGVTTIGGRYFQEDNGTLEIEIGGTIAGTEFDQLNVGDAAELAGTLEVLLYDLGNGLFTPAVGDTFDIVTASSISGTFENVLVPELAAGAIWLIDYSAEMVTLAIAGPDFDGDGDVDGDDFLVWQSGFGATGGAMPTDGDADGDGDVDGDDFLVWQANFGAGTGAGSATAVPEPGGCAILALLLGMVATVHRHCDRRSARIDRG